MRLDKFLAYAGLGSRKEVKKRISQGQVCVNGSLTKDSGTIINEYHDEIRVAGEVLTYQKYYYFMLNKPQGYVSATEDRRYPTVTQIIDPEDCPQELFPVGRLDVDTTGLLLLTNNGNLAHQLLSPKKKVAKTYRVLVDGIITEADRRQLQQGIDLGDFVTQPAEMTLLHRWLKDNRSEISLTITEGKYHQVKRMIAALGKEVLALDRLSMGPLTLDKTLKRGAYRPLTYEEQARLHPFGLK